ncbi:MAG TPA: DUF3999 family protein [Clostridia bacterium]|nr:DUF3999 family protein [Clostridia bacterium]
MRRTAGWAAMVIACVVVAMAASEARREYFEWRRDVRVAHADRQNYLAIDADIWERTRRDLGDLRLYAQDGSEVPYALEVENGRRSQQHAPVRVLDLGAVGATTEFKLEIWGPESKTAPVEYDTVTLDLGTRNFITRALVEGEDDPNALAWTRLGSGTIFDFKREDLGSNFSINLPAPARFRYLRVRIPGRVAPDDVNGATVATTEETKAAWTPLRANVQTATEGKDSVITWAAGSMPVESVQFAIAGQDNFRRSVELQDADGHVLATGEIARVHLTREGKPADREQLVLDLHGPQYSSKFKLLVHNGDDRPLAIQRVVPMAYERRLYFYPTGKTEFALCYGDKELERPTYDLANWFRRDPEMQKAELAAPQNNPDFKGRPDSRPWTDRHAWVLWAALIAAVVGLGAVALSGMRKSSG